MTGKGSPMTHKGTEIKGSKLKMTDVDLALAYSDNSPVKKTKLQSTKSSVVDVTNGFETAWAGMLHLISYFYIIERAAMDAAQVEQLESVLSEALCLESQLKEKKEHLRRSLAIISDKLQG
ncbi:testis-expressed sequence 12 protein isoform X1 [Astyanax mexicanus]|uniref:Testis-expressed sequence 12 protein isoform X1 n=1 Tax=Astyanax mexicanus TaxID=7994 RepID=A0A8T2L8X1_ASTMX|nr:testis-expressed sequence 12 protein isoform X1 [Astyanax mexicanus]